MFNKLLILAFCIVLLNSTGTVILDFSNDALFSSPSATKGVSVDTNSGGVFYSFVDTNTMVTATTYTFNAPYVIQFWLKPTGVVTAGAQIMIAEAASNANDVKLNLDSANVKFTATINAGSAVDVVNTATTAATAVSEFWVFKMALDGTVIIHKNGITTNIAGTPAGTPVAQTSAARTITLGAVGAGAGFVGDISDFVIWNGGVTDAEILSKACVAPKFAHITANVITSCATCNAACNGCHNPSAADCLACASGYIDVSGTCTACTAPCATCTGTITACDTCTDAARLPASDCDCPATFAAKLTTPPTCQACTSPCLNCGTTVTECTSCVSTHFLASGATTCTACTTPCLTCTGTATTCGTCITTTLGSRTEPTCACAATFYSTTPGGQCLACMANCATCDAADSCLFCKPGFMTIATGCIECSANSFGTAPDCTVCPTHCDTCDSATACQSCAGLGQTVDGHRDIADLCSCPAAWYSAIDGSANCLMCNEKCLTCETSASNCLTCVVSDPVRVATTCACPAGYLEATTFAAQCAECMSGCITCVDSESCESCRDSDTRDTLANDCVCLNGKVEADPVDDDCVAPAVASGASMIFSYIVMMILIIQIYI